MFTGIVYTQARVTARTLHKGDARFTFHSAAPLPDLTIGESIAVNGACLTVETGARDLFTAFASAETLRCTTLKHLAVNQQVNIERALSLGDRLGGHVVSGHVDAVAIVDRVAPVGESRCIRLRVPTIFAPEIIPKGSVTLDGISLTVNDCGADFVEVNVIPETWRVTTVSAWQAGTEVNFETDVLAKYVRRNLACMGLSAPSREPSRLTEQFLHDNGFV